MGNTGLEGSLMTLSKYSHIICAKVLNGTLATWNTALFLFTFSDFGSISKSSNELSLLSSEGGNLSSGKLEWDCWKYSDQLEMSEYFCCL